MYAQLSDDAGVSETLVAEALQATAAALGLDGKRTLVIIPDATRTAPIPLLFRLLGDTLGQRANRLDFLIALGTHPPLSPAAIDRLVGMDESERATHYPRSEIYNHHWDQPGALVEIGRIPREETLFLTDGLLVEETPVSINRRLLEYDHIVICGPVFPHEVAGFSGGAKYLFPGVAGPEIINYTHWLGALVTTMRTIGVVDTPVRRIIHRAAELLPRPLTCVALVMRDSQFCGLYAGGIIEAFEAAVNQSARLNIHHLPHAYKSVLSAPSTRYDDLWTAAKAMYKTEPVVEDGGEVIIYAPHITEVSYSHGALIDAIGYHVRDYFLVQWERFRDTPGMILAHSTHVRGAGTYDVASGIESPRIRVTLATGIPRERCEGINLGYRDFREIDPHDWVGQDDEGRLLVEHAGEVLYRLRSD
jgi:nickel-dependent lactate racemase